VERNDHENWKTIVPLIGAVPDVLVDDSSVTTLATSPSGITEMVTEECAVVRPLAENTDRLEWLNERFRRAVVS
jgi:hypothetical protein